MARIALSQPSYAHEFLPSGSTLLDLCNGGGWGLGRVVNIVGDRAVGKTLIAIEACANFAKLYSPSRIRYNEVEAAFNRTYAESMGLPKNISFCEDCATVEQFDKDLTEWLEAQKEDGPYLYVLDSLDALSDDAEMGREMGDATYGTGKAKALSEMFRRRISLLRDKRCLLMIISQIRDKIGVTFGETKTRSGGRALDFYASQIVWLHAAEKITQQVSGVKRVVGVDVIAKNKKNKLGLPFREATFEILFNFGIDDESSMIDWLKANKGSIDPAVVAKELKTARVNQDREAVRAIAANLRTLTHARWHEIEAALTPPMRKYE